MYVTHDRVHCHWRSQCHIPLFASFGNWDGRLQWMPSLVIQMDECLVNKHDTLKLRLKVWGIIASYQDLFWVMIGRIIFCPGPFMGFMHPHLQDIHFWFQHKADSDGACPACIVLSHHSRIITQTSSKSCQMCANDPPDHKEKLQVAKRLVVQISRKETINWHEMWQSLQRYNCIVWQWRFYPIRKTCKKWKLTLSSSMAMYSVMRDIHDANKDTNEKRMSCSLLIICHMQIFKLIDFRTMGLWKWITFILIHTVEWHKQS